MSFLQNLPPEVVAALTVVGMYFLQVLLSRVGIKLPGINPGPAPAPLPAQAQPNAAVPLAVSGALLTGHPFLGAFLQLLMQLLLTGKTAEAQVVAQTFAEQSDDPAIQAMIPPARK